MRRTYFTNRPEYGGAVDGREDEHIKGGNHRKGKGGCFAATTGGSRDLTTGCQNREKQRERGGGRFSQNKRKS